ncbi:condensation domain-containing protein [Saccharothrix sp.]|uniref:condensation domain-containing protein n=1 Tax=Saccharothrix sp. TaxID=1873460 RepID=UPI002811C085|nr:condensation domain-containing protein [Saccharothrix sp.]
MRERRVTVPFSGPGAGTAPLTWGQKAIMRDMRATGWPHNNSGAHPLPEGVTVAELAARLGEMMCRHPALRMRLGVGDDGEPCQVVVESGEIDVEVTAFDDDVDPAEVLRHSHKIWFEWMMTPFDGHTPWLVRLAVLEHRGRAAHLVFAVNHLVADGTGTLLLMTGLGIGELADRRLDPDAITALDLARREQTPEARRISDGAMRYWAERLRDLPRATFGEPRYPEGRLGHRYWHGRFSSSAAHLGVLAIARRTRTDTARVLLAVLAIAIGRATGVDPLTTNVIVSNRFRPGFADVIGTLSQNSVLSLDLRGTVDEVVARTRHAATAAWMRAYYDPDQLDRLIASLDAERGHPAAVTCRISDLRFSTRPDAEELADGDPVTEEQVRAELPRTFLSWDGHLDAMPDQLFISVEDRPGTVHLQMVFDMAVLTTDQVETMLHAVEEVAVEAAFDPTAPAIGPTSPAAPRSS